MNDFLRNALQRQKKVTVCVCRSNVRGKGECAFLLWYPGDPPPFLMVYLFFPSKQTRRQEAFYAYVSMKSLKTTAISSDLLPWNFRETLEKNDDFASFCLNFLWWFSYSFLRLPVHSENAIYPPLIDFNNVVVSKKRFHDRLLFCGLWPVCIT